MSIKSADVLRNLIYNEKQLVVTPLLDPDRQLHEGSASVDLRLGTRFTASRRGYLPHIDTFDSDFEAKVANLQDSYYVNIGDEFVLHPNHFVLGTTLEYLHLPSNLAGNVVTRSSWGRYGLVIATAMLIHPGFAGPITLELRNLAEVPLILHPGLKILQIFFYDVEQDNAEAFDNSQYIALMKPGPGKFDPKEEDVNIIKNFTNIEAYPFLY